MFCKLNFNVICTVIEERKESALQPRLQPWSAGLLGWGSAIASGPCTVGPAPQTRYASLVSVQVEGAPSCPEINPLVGSRFRCRMSECFPTARKSSWVESCGLASHTHLKQRTGDGNRSGLLPRLPALRNWEENVLFSLHNVQSRNCNIKC